MTQPTARCRRAALLLALVLLAACGKEAPPRAALPTPGAAAAARLPTVTPRRASTPRPTDAATTPPPADAVPTATAAQDPRALGDPNAPITVVEYTDFQCPFCATFVRETKTLLDNEYIKTGKVYYLYRDFPLTSIHPGAMQAAHAARCAAEQGHFWEMHARLFRGQDAGEWGSGDARDLTTFVGYAEELKLDGAALRQCVASQKYAAAIEGDLQDGIKRGVRGTPSFFVNDQRLVGAQPIGNWRLLLDKLLAP